MTRLVWSLGLGVAFSVFVACQAETSAPGQLGDCMPTKDAGCTGRPNGAGGNGGSSDAGDAAGDGAPPEDVGAGCGAAGQTLNAQNPNCQPCIAASCCSSDTTCSNSAACLAIVTCVESSCPTLDPICVGNCENTNPSGVGDYNDFGSCLAMSCNPTCPQLPQGSPTGDL